MDKEEQVSWRELLGRLIHDPQERQRIANELGVGPITITRWVNNTTNPRIQNVRQLLRILPQHREQLLTSIAQEFPDWQLHYQDEHIDDDAFKIPSEFYTRIISSYTTTPGTQRFWSLTNLILQQALGQLDPNHVGMAIVLIQCMPPSGDVLQVRSLRERVGRGTSPWNVNLDQQAIFLGVDSLPGNVVTNGRPRIIQDKQTDREPFPAHWEQWGNSAAAYPIMRTGSIAGCLLVASTQPDYFIPYRQELIANYSELLTLAFEPHEFYQLEQINLHTMPAPEAQAPYFSSFRRRVSELMLQAAREGQVINLIQAQQMVWQQLEAEMLQLPPE